MSDSNMEFQLLTISFTVNAACPDSDNQQLNMLKNVSINLKFKEKK
ncbi:MAG: hypothetical protein HQK65_16425 [Desulfamplus sp.]|nr:hypothetical protein [Desulfamplus sp.]